MKTIVIFAYQNYILIPHQLSYLFRIVSWRNGICEGGSYLFKKIYCISICQAIVGGVVFSKCFLKEKRPQLYLVALRNYIQKCWSNILTEISLRLWQFCVDDYWNVVINDHVFPDICLGLMNFDSIEALLVNFLILKYLVKELVLKR